MLDASPTPTTSSRRPVILAVLITALALLAAGGAAYFLVFAESESNAPAFRITGTVTITTTAGTTLYSETATDGEPCQMMGDGYADLPGAQVVVTDADGTAIATGRLDSIGYYQTNPRGCEWSFEVEGVPGGHDFYGVEIGRRGGMKYTPEQLSKPLELTLK